MRVSSQVIVNIYEGTDSDDKLYGPDQPEVITDSPLEEHSGRFQIAALGSYTPGLGTITSCYGLTVRGSESFTLAINGGAAVTYTRAPGAPASSWIRFFMDGAVTSVIIGNPDAEDAIAGSFAMWGDVT